MSSDSLPRRSTLILADRSKIASTLTPPEVSRHCDPDRTPGRWPLVSIPLAGPSDAGKPRHAIVGVHQIVRVLESR